jgi:site-specific DNA-methyltransferase (adenine-specific)
MEGRGMTPFFDRAPQVRLYHGNSLALWPHLVAEGARGVVMFDPQYSEHVHGKSRAGARKAPLHNGDGRLSKASISRTKDFGFDPMTEADRAVFAVAAAAMTTRWCLVFSDLESAHLWRLALTSAGLEYVRTGLWHKLGGTPQFTGDRPAVAVEAITICHARGVEKRWNGGGHHAWWTSSEGPSLEQSAHELATFVLGLEDVPEALLEHALNALRPRELVLDHQIVCEHGGSKEGEPRVHETQKPESLMVELIDLFADPGELVIDLTAGSSTTLVAAVRRGRRAWGVEKREKDVLAGTARLEAELAGVAYYARKSGQTGLFEGRDAPAGALS